MLFVCRYVSWSNLPKVKLDQLFSYRNQLTRNFNPFNKELARSTSSNLHCCILNGSRAHGNELFVVRACISRQLAWASKPKDIAVDLACRMDWLGYSHSLDITAQIC